MIGLLIPTYRHEFLVFAEYLVREIRAYIRNYLVIFRRLTFLGALHTKDAGDFA